MHPGRLRILFPNLSGSMNNFGPTISTTMRTIVRRSLGRRWRTIWLRLHRESVPSAISGHLRALGKAKITARTPKLLSFSRVPSRIR